MSRFLIAAVVAAGILAGAAVAHQMLRERATEVPGLERATLYQEPRPLPGFSLVDQDGARFGPSRLRGRWSFLFFGFVNCPDICPATLATLAAARNSLDELPADARPGVTLVSVDPGRDTPAILGRYVSHFDRSFQGVTGSPAEIDALARNLGVAVLVGASDDTGNYPVDHSAAIFLVDPQGRVAALFSAPHDAAVIARDFRRIVEADG
jgi:protein SCO1/2